MSGWMFEWMVGGGEGLKKKTKQNKNMTLKIYRGGPPNKVYMCKMLVKG